MIYAKFYRLHVQRLPAADSDRELLTIGGAVAKTHPALSEKGLLRTGMNVFVANITEYMLQKAGEHASVPFFLRFGDLKKNHARPLYRIQSALNYDEPKGVYRANWEVIQAFMPV